MPTRYLRLGPREQDTGSDDTSRRTEQDEEEFWPKLDKKTADRIGILNRWIYPVCRSVGTSHEERGRKSPSFLVFEIPGSPCRFCSENANWPFARSIVCSAMDSQFSASPFLSAGTT